MSEERYTVTNPMHEGQFYDDPDRNMGSYQTSAEPFNNPSDVKFFAGQGATAEDLERGWVKPVMREYPEYVLENYKRKWTQERVTDEDCDGGMDLPRDLKFRQKDLVTKGLFARPHIPTER